MATCHDCKVDYPFNLDRHHIIPRGMPGAEDPSNLVDICPNCHRTRHTGEAADSIPWIRAHTPEANAKRTETMRKRWQDPDYRARQLADRASRVGVPRPPSVGQKVSAALKGKPFTEEHRAALSRALKGKPVSPETRAKLSAALKGRRRSPETVARMTAARHARPPAEHSTQSPEANAKRSEAMKRRWAEGTFAERDQHPEKMADAIRRAWDDEKYANREFRPHEGQCTCCGETEPAFLFARKKGVQHCRNCWKATLGGAICPHQVAK